MSATLLTVPLSQLVESPRNVRRRHDDDAATELVESVKALGILTPALARPIAGTSPQRYELAAGHRRLRAARAAQLQAMPVVVRPMDDREFMEILVTENLQRQNPDPLDEADGFARLRDELGYDVAALCGRFGKSPTYVRERLALTQLGEDARRALEAAQIELGHAIALARTEPDEQTRLLREVLHVHEPGETTLDDGELEVVTEFGADDDVTLAPLPAFRPRTTVSVLELRRAMAERTRPLAHVPWLLDDATLVPAAGACTTCPKRSHAEPELFAELAAAEDRCLDSVCYRGKREAWLARKVEAVAAQGDVLLVSLDYRGVPKTLGGRPVLSRAKWEYATGRTAAKKKRLALVVHGPDSLLGKLGQTIEIVLAEDAPKTSAATKTAEAGESWEDRRARGNERYQRLCEAVGAACTAIRGEGWADAATWLEATVADAILAGGNDTWDVAALFTDEEREALHTGGGTPGVRAAAAVVVALGDHIAAPGIGSWHLQDTWPVEDSDLAAPGLLQLGTLRGVDVVAVVRAALGAQEPAPAETARDAAPTPRRRRTPAPVEA